MRQGSWTIPGHGNKILLQDRSLLSEDRTSWIKKGSFETGRGWLSKKERKCQGSTHLLRRLCLPLGGTTGSLFPICLQQSPGNVNALKQCALPRPPVLACAACLHLRAEQVPRKGTPNLTWIQMLTLVLLSQRFLVRLLSLFPQANEAHVPLAQGSHEKEMD